MSFLEDVFFAAVRAGDAKGVDAALRLLAVEDPRRAEQLVDQLRLALDIALVSEDLPS